MITAKEWNLIVAKRTLNNPAFKVALWEDYRRRSLSNGLPPAMVDSLYAAFSAGIDYLCELVIDEDGIKPKLDYIVHFGAQMKGYNFEIMLERMICEMRLRRDDS